MPDEEGWLPPHQPNCLGCGDENPAGLGLRLRMDGDHVRGEVTLDRRHEGAPGFAHGGAVATLLDDALGTILLVRGRPAVTARLEIDYRRPVLIGQRIEIEAWLARIEGRKLHLAGTLTGDELLAEAKAIFVEVGREHFLKGAGPVPEGWHGASPPSTLPW